MHEFYELHVNSVCMMFTTLEKRGGTSLFRVAPYPQPQPKSHDKIPVHLLSDTNFRLVRMFILDMIWQVLDLSGLDLEIVPEAAMSLHDFGAASNLRMLDLSGVVQKGGNSLPLVLPPGLVHLNLERAMLARLAVRSEYCMRSVSC